MKGKVFMAIAMMAMLSSACKKQEEKRTKAPVLVKTEQIEQSINEEGRTYVGVPVPRYGGSLAIRRLLAKV